MRNSNFIFKFEISIKKNILYVFEKFLFLKNISLFKDFLKTKGTTLKYIDL